MSLSLDEKLKWSAVHAQEKEAEKHFFDTAQPFFPLGFSISWRNPGHWDIYADQVPGKHAAWLTAHGPSSSINGDTIDDIDRLKHQRLRERAFCIRGEPGDVYVRDERWDPHRPHPREPLKFRSVLAAVIWIAEELMQEPPSAPAPAPLSLAAAPPAVPIAPGTAGDLIQHREPGEPSGSSGREIEP